MQRSELQTVKAFVSRRVDRFRPAYARRTVDFPRRCVFAASTNESAYLRDPTGARRFWPVRCGVIYLDALRVQRDQLWAEAVVRYRAGETWHPDAALAIEAGAEQEARYQGDAWEDAISGYVEGKGEVTVREVGAEVLKIEIGRLTQADQNRVARALQRLGWTTTGNPVHRTIEGKQHRVRVYTPPAQTEPGA
jgi:predicted P-loop ATPase